MVFCVALAGLSVVDADSGDLNLDFDLGRSTSGAAETMAGRPDLVDVG